jgi:hypothetical protein
MGWHLGERRFLTADVCDTSDLETKRLPLRWSTEDELADKNIEKEDPCSVAEHYAITRKLTVYGPARVPYSKLPALKYRPRSALAKTDAQRMLEEVNPEMAARLYSGQRPKHVPMAPKLELVQSIPADLKGGKHRRG